MTFNIEWWDIDKVIPYARNARKIPQVAIDKVAASIQEFGWRQPIVVDKKGVVVAGHVRLLGAQKLKLAQVPVHVASDLTDAQIKAYRLMDNRSHQETEWDLDLIGPELKELEAFDFDLALTGFDSREIDEFLKPPAAATPEENIPDPPAVPVTRPGDIWLLGEAPVCPHCGAEN